MPDAGLTTVSRTDPPADYGQLPQGLPVPLDDGACRHLTGKALPSFSLPATDGREIDLSTVPGWGVLYCYPMTGRPGVALPDGWDAIPGARGCTPQSCGFRDRFAELKALDVEIYGMSAQSTAYQQEAADRLHLPFPLLSDAGLRYTDLLGLPTFEVDGSRLNKRVTLILQDGVIRKYFYPVFPPDRNIHEVLDWLSADRDGTV
jgi:peroxiredoxin